MESVVKDWESTREQALLEKLRSGALSPPGQGKRKKLGKGDDSRSVRQKTLVDEGTSASASDATVRMALRLLK